MKKILLSMIGLCLLATTVNATETVKKLLISKVVDHPALDATEAGIKAALASRGYEVGKNLVIRTESAQGSPILAGQIATKFIHQNPDLVVGIGTITAQSFAKLAREGKVKMIFSSVSDPLGAGLIKALDRPENNSSGVSNFVPIEPQLELFKKLQPNLKKLGIIYNPGEENSVSILKKIEAVAPSYKLQIIKKAATKTSEVAQTAVALAQNSDAIFISNDNTALAALQSVIKAAHQAGVPVYVSDTDAVKLGAVAALGPNQYMVGEQTGLMMVRVLNGADINLQQVEFPEKTDLYLNLDAAKRANIIIPADLIKSAEKIITSNE